MKMRLEDAVDYVAARMTAVEEDDGLALRIVSSLPERSPWVWHGRLPRFAIGALAALIIAVVLRPFDARSPVVLQTQVASAPVSAPAPIVEPSSNDRRTAVEPAQIVRRTIAEPSLNVRRTDEDHEFSLPAIEAIAALGVDALAPANLAENAPLTVAPLAIADLALTGDFPPR